MHTYTSPPRSARKARELLTTSGGAPKPEPELWVRVAQQARALGDLAGSIVSMWIVEVLGANPHQLGDLRGLLLGAAHLRGNVADVLGLDVAVLVALLRVHLLLQGFKISSNCSHEVAVTALFISDAQCVPGRTSFDKTYLENLVEKVAQVTRAAHIVLATCGLGPAFSRATTQSKRQGTERSLMKTWMACSGT